MPPQEFSFRLQKGITGGFAPPTPEAIITVTRPKDHPSLQVSSATRELGTASLQDALPKSLTVDDSHTTELIGELHAILSSLPTEHPPGSEDIYGLDTSIAWGSDDLEWCNGGPQGCNGGNSSVKANEEQKSQFKRAVEIVHELTNKAK